MKKVVAFLIALVLTCMLPLAGALADGSKVFTFELNEALKLMCEFQYEYDADLMIVSVLEISNPYPIARAGYQYKDATYSKYFYIISTGEKVAEYSLTANFRYDTAAALAECRSTSTASKSLKTGWTISRLSTVDNVSPALGAGRGDFTLYYNGNEANTDSIVIYCDHKGTITNS